MQGVLRLIGDSGKVEVASQCWGSCCRVCVALCLELLNAQVLAEHNLSF